MFLFKNISVVGICPTHKVLTHIAYRAVSGVFQTIDAPPPLHPASVSSPRSKGGGYTLAGRWGGGGSIVRKTPDIGLASYSIIPPRSHSPPSAIAYRLSHKHLSATQREERLREKGRELTILSVLARSQSNLPYGRRPPCSLVWSGEVLQLLLSVAVGHPEETGHPFSATSVNWEKKGIRGGKIVLFVNIFGSLEGLYKNGVTGLHIDYSVGTYKIVLSQCTYVINFKKIKTGYE